MVNSNGGVNVDDEITIDDELNDQVTPFYCNLSGTKMYIFVFSIGSLKHHYLTCK